MTNKLYTITKLNISEGQSSAIQAGYKKTYDYMVLYGSGTAIPKGDTVADVDVGLQVICHRGILDYMNTSPIQEILERGEGFVRFRTVTSEYLLEEHEDEDTRD